MARETVLHDLINREEDKNVPLVVLMCGVAGSGKTDICSTVRNEWFYTSIYR